MNTKKIIVVAFLSLCAFSKVIAQQVGFTYQAVAIDESKAQGFGRDSRGEILVNKDISLRFSIREGTEDGETKYQETHHTTTDIFGIFRLVIGRGLNVTGSNLKDLQWGETAYFLQVEIDLGNGFEFMGAEELLGVPYALNSNKQVLSIEQNTLSISNGNSVVLNDNDPTNELITGFSIQGTDLQISDAGGSRTVDLKDLAGGTLNEAEVDAFVSNNGYLTNEIQDLNLTGTILSITNNNAATQIDLSPFLDDTNLTESEVDAYVSNNGFLTIEIDGSVTNEIQNISTNGTAGNISIENGATLNLNVDDADADPANEIQDLSLSGNNLSITNNAGAALISLAPYLDAAFSTTTNVTSNAPGNYATDDFVFGGPDLNSSGSKFFFDKSRSAFRVGQVTGTQWSDANLGTHTFASGFNTNASGFGTAAFGVNNQASGSGSFVAGVSNQVNSSYSFAAGGINNVINGSGSTAFGSFSTINAGVAGGVSIGSYNLIASNGSIGLGSELHTQSLAEVVIGRANTDYVAASTFLWNATDRLFIVGNGPDAANRSDALIMLKNGNTRLHGQLTIDADNVSGAGGDYTFPGQRGINGQVMITDGSGVLSWSTLLLSAFTTAAGVTSNAPGNYATDDFVFGSPQLADDNDPTHDSRMFFDKSKGAFRAGNVSGNQWDDSNIGVNSIAMGANAIASGITSVALGGSSIASGSFDFAARGGIATGGSSVALGGQATGFGSVSIGHTTVSSGQHSVALGSFSTATEFGSLASGLFSTATAINATAIGNSSVASAGGAFAIGLNNNASGEGSSSFGGASVASGYGSMTLGGFALSRSYFETALGLNNTNYIPLATLTFNGSDRLIVIGNGTTTFSRSDALVMLKNGNTRLHGQLTIDADNVSGAGLEYRLPGQDGTAGHLMVTDGAGNVSWTNVISGDLTVAGIFSNPSDKKLKRNITPLENSLSNISSLRGYHYNWNKITKQDTVALQTGLIAQELEVLFPELVKTDSDGFKSVNYIGLIPHLIEAVKELKIENDKLKKQNNISDEKVSDFEARLKQIEKLLLEKSLNNPTAKSN